MEFKKDYPNLLTNSYERVKNGTGLVCTDQKAKEGIRNTANWLLKKIKNTILKGQPVMNISLPIFISDYRSMLQVFAYELRHSPIFINKIQSVKEPIEKLKWASVFLMSQLYFSPLQTKPFNPIIGETYQCKIGDMNIYLEQTVHKPPTGNFYCYDDNKTYKYYGYCSTSASTGANSCKAIKSGKIILEFNDGYKYSIYYPTVWVGGTLFGKQMFNYKHVCLVVDELNKLVSYMSINPTAEKGFFKKLISMKEPDFPDIIKGDIILQKDLVFGKKNKHTHDKKCKSLSKITGFWTQYLSFDDVKYWEREKYFPLNMYELPNKLPSDSSLRTDMNLWIEQKEPEAQAEKEKLEEIQRNDNKLRFEYELSKDPVKKAEWEAQKRKEEEEAKKFEDMKAKLREVSKKAEENAKKGENKGTPETKEEEPGLKEE